MLEKSAELRKSEEHNEALCERMQDLNSELFTASNINGKLHMKRVHDLNQMGGQCEEIARLKAEVDALMTNPTSRLLRAEREENAYLNNYIERLEVRNAVLVPDNARLKAEAVNLKEVIADLRISAEDDLHSIEAARIENARLQADIKDLREDRIRMCNVTIEDIAVIARLKAEVERLRKAGDAVALDYAERIEIEAGNPAKTLMKTVPVLREWKAAKDGKPSV